MALKSLENINTSGGGGNYDDDDKPSIMFIPKGISEAIYVRFVDNYYSYPDLSTPESAGEGNKRRKLWSIPLVAKDQTPQEVMHDLDTFGFEHEGKFFMKHSFEVDVFTRNDDGTYTFDRRAVLPMTGAATATLKEMDINDDEVTDHILRLYKSGEKTKTIVNIRSMCKVPDDAPTHETELDLEEIWSEKRQMLLNWWKKSNGVKSPKSTEETDAPIKVEQPENKQTTWAVDATPEEIKEMSHQELKAACNSVNKYRMGMSKAEMVEALLPQY